MTFCLGKALCWSLQEMQFRMIRQYNSCVFLDFSIPSSGQDHQRRQRHGLAKPLMVWEGVGFFLMNEPDISRSPQAMGDGMAKTRKAKQTKGKPKRKETGRPPDPVFQTLQQPPRKPHDSAIGLNDSYGKSQLVLLPVEPFTVHVYWNLNPDEQEKARKALGQGFVQAQSILRFYDVTNIVFDGTNARGLFDIPVDLQTRNCYVRLWSPQKTYFVELGWKTDQDHFFPVARSNSAHTPSAWPADAAPHLPKRSEDSFRKTEGDAVSRPPEDAMGALPLTGSECNAVDLTTRSEQAFASGVSSGIAASSPKKENGRED
jgi:hypothetical protein